MMIPKPKSKTGRSRPILALRSAILFLLIALLALPAAAADPILKKASLIPLWSPQAQFAGYYVALDKGIYARHGIDLTILNGGPGHSPLQTLLKGEADFAVLWLITALQERARGTELVNLAQIVQRSSQLLISRKSSKIRSVSEMNDKRVGLWGGDLSLPTRALFAREGVEVREVPQSHTVNLFLRGGIDVTSAMLYNEYHTILNSGVDPEELNIVSLSEQGLNFPEDGIYTMEKSLQQDPARAQAFVAASLEGWRYAFDHPDEALDIVSKYMGEAQIPANRIHQRWMLERIRDLILPATRPGAFGLLMEEDYRAVGWRLQKDGLLPGSPDYRTFTGGDYASKK